MKLLVIHNRNYHASGPETYLFNLKKEIKKYVHHLDVFALNYSKTLTLIIKIFSKSYWQ